MQRQQIEMDSITLVLEGSIRSIIHNAHFLFGAFF